MARVEMPSNPEDRFPSNSHRSKEREEEPQPVKPIVTDGVTKKNRSLGKKLKDTFIVDSGDSIADYVVWDILVPAAKDTLSNTLKTIVDMALYGEKRRDNRNVVRDRRESYVRYDRMNDRPSARVVDGRRTEVRNTSYFCDDVILNNRGDAEDVLDTLQDTIEQYGDVSVAYLYQLVGLPSQKQDNYYGWSDLKTARVVDAGGGGWLLDLPRARAFR